MWPLPYFFSIVGLIALLILNERSHRKTEKGLIDKILIQRGLEPIPESHPLAEALEALGAKPKNPIEAELERRKKRLIGMPQEKVSFKIPGIPQGK